MASSTFFTSIEPEYGDVSPAGHFLSRAWFAMRRFSLPRLSVFLLLAACSGGGPTAMESSPSNTPERTIAGSTMTVPPTTTNSPVRTPTRTLLPSVTPIPSVTPDLELLDPVFFGYYDNFAVIGRIRNNTNTPLYLGGEEGALEITLESWSASENLLGTFLHITHGPAIIKNDRYDYPRTTYVVFPGETGVVASPLSCYKQEACKTDFEQSLDPPETLGYSFQVQSKAQPYSGKTPRNILHPKPENIKVSVRDGLIFFRFDMPHPTVDYDRLYIIVLLLDGRGSIINSAAGSLYYPEEATGMAAMINTVGYIEPWGEELDPLIRMSPEDVQRVDHLEIFIELTGTD
jgi:hypothetical protein